MPVPELICPVCGAKPVLVTGADIYPRRLDLKDKAFWRCPKRHSYVGCHPRTTKPLGTLATEEIRRARRVAHKLFDNLWKLRKCTRRGAYAWLAGKLNIPVDKCHIALFAVDKCKLVIRICMR